MSDDYAPLPYVILPRNVALIDEGDDSRHSERGRRIHRAQLAIGSGGEDEGGVELAGHGRNVAGVLGLPSALRAALHLRDGLPQRVEGRVGAVRLVAAGDAARDGAGAAADAGGG